ncbi:MAG: DUF6340 family protein [Arenibacter troitsensis]|nr:DUF6340 family protein [Arenibacter troitsensis]
MRKFCAWFFLLGLLASFVGCGSTKEIVLQTLEPSPVHITHKIKRIGIVHRSIRPEADEDETGLNRMVAAEEQWLSEQGRNAALTGLFNELLKDNRFETVKILDSIPQDILHFEMGNDSISWTSVENICNTYDVDAIFSMAFFDTETKITLKKTSMIQPNLMRVKVKVPAQELTLETLIENGWKIYYPNSKEIIDEIVFNDQVISKGKGTNPIEAYKAIEDRKETLVEQSKASGSNYGQRLLPFENSVERSYFARGTTNFEQASVLVESGDWQGASQLWQKELDNANSKIAGRACYNMAILNESNGDFRAAMDWASKSYKDHDIKDAMEYLDILKHRLFQNQILEQQVSR